MKEAPKRYLQVESLKDELIKALKELNDFYGNNFGINMAVAKAIQLKTESNIEFPEWIDELLKKREHISSLTSQIADAEKEEITIGMTVYHKNIYKGKESMKVVGIRENEIELQGDYSGGTHNVCQTGWIDKEGILFQKDETPYFDTPQPEQSSVPDAERFILNTLDDWNDKKRGTWKWKDISELEYPSPSWEETRELLEQYGWLIKAQAGQGKETYSKNDIDFAYCAGIWNTGGIDVLSKELDRLKELNVKPYQIFGRHEDEVNESLHSAVQKPSEVPCPSLREDGSCGNCRSCAG